MVCALARRVELLPDLLRVALCLGAIHRSLRFAALCALAPVLCGVFDDSLGCATYAAVALPIREI